jgi:hypothetical protein
MRRIVCGLVTAALVSLALGCSSDKDRGINSNKEKPREPKGGAHLLKPAPAPAEPDA